MLVLCIKRRCYLPADLYFTFIEFLYYSHQYPYLKTRLYNKCLADLPKLCVRPGRQIVYNYFDWWMDGWHNSGFPKKIRCKFIYFIPCSACSCSLLSIFDCKSSTARHRDIAVYEYVTVHISYEARPAHGLECHVVEELHRAYMAGATGSDPYTRGLRRVAHQDIGSIWAKMSGKTPPL